MRSSERNDIALSVYAEICREGGRTVKQIATALNLLPRYVNEALMQLEKDKLLISEDEHGGLWEFKYGKYTNSSMV